MKKQSSRARAQQSTPPVRHQLDHVVPTVIHNPEEDMTALGRWARHAMQEPRRYMGWPVAIIGGVILLAIASRLLSGRSTADAEMWKKLDAAKTPAERSDIAKTNPKSPAATWAMLQAATEYFGQALADMPNNRDVAVSTAKKALELFEEVGRDAPHDSPQARMAALGKARVLEMRNDLPQAIEQYQVVAKEWPGTPEAEEATQYAEALKDPQAASFYKELYAYSPTKVTLPPLGTETFPPPGGGLPPVSSMIPGANVGSPASPPSDQPPTLSPGLGAIPGIREVIEPRAGAPAGTAQPKAGMPEAKPQPPTAKPAAPTAKPAAPTANPAAPTANPAAAEKKDLPGDVFTPKAGESKPK
jgi:hypothetical protein